jgi:hypothetical protein
MPTKRTRRTQPVREELQVSMRTYLLSGNWKEIVAAADASGDRLVQVLFHVHEHPRLWAESQHELIDEWIAERPGTRPAGFWEFAAFEPRRWVNNDGVATAPDIGPDWCLWRDQWGIVLDDRAGRRVVAVESEPNYLARLGLFLPGERRRLPRDAFEPIVVAEAFDLNDDDDDEDDL